MSNAYDKLLKLKRYRDKLEQFKDQLKEQYKKDFIPAIINEIERNQKHSIMVEDFATPFTQGNEGYQKTGYQWFFTEPLIELGVKNFDLLLFNATKKSVILVECKSSISSNFLEDELKDLSVKIKNAEENIVHLSEVLGSEIKHLEYVLCVTGKDISKVKGALEGADALNLKKIITWVNDGFNGVVKLDSIKTHVYGNLNRSSEFNIKGNRTKIEFLYSSHPARIFQSVISQIYSEKYRRRSIDNTAPDPKLLTKKEIIDCLRENLKLGCDEGTKSRIISSLAQKLIELGTYSKALEPHSSGTLKIISSFSKLEKVSDEIKEKYVDYEADKRAEERAREEAARRFVNQVLKIKGF